MNQPSRAGDHDMSSEQFFELLAQIDEGIAVNPHPGLVAMHADYQAMLQLVRQVGPLDDGGSSLPPECQEAVDRAIALFPTAKPDPTVREAGSVTMPPRLPQSLTHELPPELGPYKLLGKLGEGGMGAVYRALHTRLDRHVAIKLLPALRTQSPAAIARFEREMKAVGRLTHENIVAATDAGEVNGVYFLAMELVQGCDLATLARSLGPLPMAEACELIRQAAVGLQHVHEHGQVHRDIKPGNLMLAATSSGAQLKILDLGLARLHEQEIDHVELTAQGQVMGTFEYMPPEQAGDTRSVDIRADIYSLGATLYKLLTGQPPFHGPAYNTPLKRLTALATQDPPRIDSLRADLPPELVGVIHRMLARQPEDRYATPAELAAAIAPFAQGADLAALLNAATKAPDGAMQPPLQRLVAGAASVSVRSGLVETQSQVVPPCSLQPAVQLAGSTKPPRRFKRSMLLAGAAVPIIALLGVILLSLRTPHGEIVIELADGIPAEAAKQLKIEVTGNGQVIVADAAAGWTIDVAEGRYQAKVSGGADQFQLEQKQITVTRGEKTLLSVSLKPTGEDASSVQQPNVTPQTPNTPPPATPEQAPTAAATAATAKPWQPTPEQQAFFDHVATLPAEEQAAAVAKKLTEVNPGFSGEFKHTISNGALTEFSFGVDHVTDIWPVRALQHLISLTCNGTINDRHVNVSKFADLAPLQGMHLNNLRLYNVAVSDLTPLAGMPLSHFHCTEASIRDLSPLAGMPLRNLNLYRCREIADLSPLLGAPLESLNCIGTTISDISPLQGMPLTMLAIANAPVTDLSPLKGMQLTQLQCERTHVKDLSPLSGMPLTFLHIGYTRVKDLSPLKGMPLKELRLNGSSVTDLSPLSGMPLTFLTISYTRVLDLSPLKGMPLKELNLFMEPASAIFQCCAPCHCTHFIMMYDYLTTII